MIGKAFRRIARPEPSGLDAQAPRRAVKAGLEAEYGIRIAESLAHHGKIGRLTPRHRRIDPCDRIRHRILAHYI